MNKKGSATILITMIAVAIIMCIVAAISVAERIVVKGECNAFGTIWTRAILSEYDVYLFKEYGILAYQGSDAEVEEKILRYQNYSMDGKLGAHVDNPTVELSQYSMDQLDNFRNALKNSMTASIVDSFIHGSERKQRASSGEEPDRRIVNRTVLDTLPSKSIDDGFDAGSFAEYIKESISIESLLAGSGDMAREIAFIRKYMNNHLTVASENETFFYNEWEYVIAGKHSDKENFNICRRRLFLIRNALNLAELYKEPEVVEAVTAIAEVITPGPMGILTQGLIMETWAALEAEADVKALLDNKRVKIMKPVGSWTISLESVIGSKDVSEALDDEAKKNIEENIDELKDISKIDEVAEELTDGQTYEDYLMFMMIAMNRNVRTLRIMDLVQIDMKLRHYRDFNLAEYYCGVAYNLNANNKEYAFVKEYK